jgi:hypothetical protein
MVIATMVSSSSAFASSSYDSHKTTSLELKNAACSKDITTDYASYLGSYAQSYQAAVMNGSVGVSELPRYSVDGYGNVIDKTVIVFWNESQQMSLEWTSWGGVIASPTTHSLMLQISSCGNGVQVSTSNFGAGYLSINDGTVENYLYRGAVAYPSEDYEGVRVNTRIQGSVQCWDTVAQVYVAANSGMSGNARLTGAYGGKAYEYNLTEPGPYRLYVTCGNELGSTPVIYDTSQTYNFVCSEEEYLGLICSES